MSVPATPLRTCKETVDVLYSHFYLQDTGGGWLDDDSLPPPSPPAGDELTATGKDWVSIVSEAQDHVAGIQLEAWSAEPPRREDWEVSADFQLTCTTGNIVPVAVMMGPSEEEIIVGPPGTYSGRVYSRGREDTRNARETGLEIPDGLEQYLVQFWSA